jgi:hypothetical protein
VQNNVFPLILQEAIGVDGPKQKPLDLPLGIRIIFCFDDLEGSCAKFIYKTPCNVFLSSFTKRRAMFFL